MPGSTLMYSDETLYRALQARDARFDGHFFTGVKTTGIYCRPVCRVRTPRAQSCEFFTGAAQAEAHGYRPCLRCRPELAPQRLPNWSIQDASQTLALQALQRLDAAALNRDRHQNISLLAKTMGVSARHLSRIFKQHHGVSPSQYLQTQRLLIAKQLLSDTALAVKTVAALSGFGSQRRFNAVFAKNYKMAPLDCRRGEPVHSQNKIYLSYRPPYDTQATLRFLAARAVDGLEEIVHAVGQQSIKEEGHSERKILGYARVLSVEVDGRTHTGWVHATFEEHAHRVCVRMSDSLLCVCPSILQRIRFALDLDADSESIEQVLHQDFPHCAGWRVPGAWEGFETAVRAILGQQITLKASTVLTSRLVHALGAPLESRSGALTHAFPTPKRLLEASPDALGALGIIKQRQRAIQALAGAVVGGHLDLNPAFTGLGYMDKYMDTLLALPGIGDWTAQYISMRCMHWPNAFPAGDVVIQNRLQVREKTQPAKSAQAALEIAKRWQPWRSYAVIRLWHGEHHAN